MSQHEPHDPNNEWKVPLFLMIGMVISVVMTAVITLGIMGVFSGDASPTDTHATTTITAESGGQ